MAKTIITGSGRAGSTFLVQLLTRLGFDTGFEPYQETYEPDLRAGAEWRGSDEELDQAPTVIKGPIWAFFLKQFLLEGKIKVRHIILPVRDLDLATKSRLDVGLRWSIPPDAGLVAIEEVWQNLIMAAAIGKVVEVCLLFSIPCTVMFFPLFVQDRDYCYRQLSEVFELDQKRFNEEFEKLARPEQIKWR